MKRSSKIAVFFIIPAVLFFGSTSVYAQRLQPDRQKETALHYYRGIVNFEAGRYENALEEFQKVAAIDPYYKDTRRYIEDSIRQMESALVEGAAAKEFQGKDLDFYFLGKSYYEKGDYSRALEAFKAVLSKNPNDRFALYYTQLCRQAMPKAGAVKKGSYLSPQEVLSASVLDMENEVAYIKDDVRSKEDMELFLEARAQDRADRAEAIRKKEQQLKKQEALLEDEKKDYLEQAKITKRANRVRRETEQWKAKKDRLVSDQPGVPSELTEFPVYISKADIYYRAMKESLRTSRWNSAGLNAIQASLYYCDALLIYYHNIKSSYPSHENITKLLLAHINRSDAEENVLRMRSILNVKKMVEDEDKPISRSQAMFLAEETEKIVEWCRAVLP